MTEGNPYQVASSPSRAIGGRVDAVAALRDGLRGALANAGTLVVCGVVGVLVYYAGVCSLLGWLLAVPALFWGFSKLFLQAARGQARFESLWIGSDHVGVRLQRAWGLLFLYLFASLPVYALLAVLSVFWLGDLLENPALLLGEGFQLKLMGLTVASSAAAATA